MVVKATCSDGRKLCVRASQRAKWSIPAQAPSFASLGTGNAALPGNATKQIAATSVAAASDIAKASNSRRLRRMNGAHASKAFSER